MAIFDPHEQRLCVRVVYDGAAGAGKTTNLRQLAALFAAQRATEVWSPSDLAGRTLYFDWMQIAAGVVAGIPLLCQVISVPGQVVLTPRRRHLLTTADVVVYVSDSSAAAAAHARDGLGVLDEVARDRVTPLPVVLQANKQDQADALDAPRLARALDRIGETVVEAIALEGIGVVDTFVAAIRALSRSYQERAERGDLHVLVARPEARHEAYARVAAEELDPEGAAEMLLVEAARSLLVEGLAPGPATSPRAGSTGQAEPSLPDADVPTGFIWPAHTGRATLRSLANAGVLGARPTLDARGVASHKACGYVLRTRTAMRFEGPEVARQALVRAARERTQLAPDLATDTAVVAQVARDGAWWLWTVMPDLPTLESALASAEPDERAPLLDAYGAALVDAVRASLRTGIGLELRPSAFGVDGDALRYIGDILGDVGVFADDLAGAVAAAVAELDREEAARVLAAFDHAKGGGDEATAEVRAVLARADVG